MGGFFLLVTYEKTILTFSETKMVSQKTLGNRWSEYGVMNLLLYLKILRDIEAKKIDPNMIITFGNASNAEKNNQRSTKSIVGEERKLKDILNQAISLNAPDCIRALCQVYGGEKETRTILGRFAREKNISGKSIISLTGRKAKNQRTNILDYYKIGLEFLTLNRSTFLYMKNTNHYINGKKRTAQSVTDLKSDTVASFYWGTDVNECMVFKDFNNELTCSIVINAETYIDAAQSSLLNYISTNDDSAITTFKLKNETVNILSDTYFGEYYTECRKRGNRIDSLTEYGYHHSMEKIATKLKSEDFNMITYEGVLIDEDQPCFNKHKVFYLGGNKHKTVNELVNRSINLANLGNNHSKDYGNRTLSETLDYFKENGIATMGAGKNIKTSIKPVVLKYKNKKTVLFSGYWYRKHRDIDFDFYASERPGVAAVEGVLLSEIRKYKQENPEDFIIVMPHWGEDFKDIRAYQRTVAKLIMSTGADMIVGSGPHKIQPIEYIDGKLVIYSMGNGVFNSDGGGLIKAGSSPYSLFLSLDIYNYKMKIYPFYNYNLKTFWQPYYIDNSLKEEMVKDIKLIDHISFMDNEKIDSEGHIYYEVDIKPNNMLTEVIETNVDTGNSLFTYLQNNIEGVLYNKELDIPKEFDGMHIFEDNLLASDENNAIFVALDPKGWQSLVGNAKWEAPHSNKYLKNSELVNKLGLIITNEAVPDLKDIVPQYIVEDPALVAAELASFVAENYKGKVVSIGGSVGKTTTRTILTQILNDYKVLTNNRNRNLHTEQLDLALNLTSNPDLAVFEVALGGLNSKGYGNEGYRMRNDIIIMTGYGYAHSMVGILRSLSLKCESFRHTKNNATAIINGDIEVRFLDRILKEAREQNLNIKLYSLNKNNVDCFLIEKKIINNGMELTISLENKIIVFKTNLFTNGDIQNIMAALLAANILLKEDELKLEKFNEIQNLIHNNNKVILNHCDKKITLIDDTHNSSIPALENGLGSLEPVFDIHKGNKIIILGAVAELGDISEEKHLSLVPVINELNADKVLLWGEDFYKASKLIKNATYFKNKEDILGFVKDCLVDDSVVYIKGSSYSKFSKVADELKKLGMDK